MRERAVGGRTVLSAAMIAVVLTAVVVVIGWPPPQVTAQQALAPYRIGYTAQSPALDRDVFSADSAGADQRDATNRPGVDESDPAYSTDGTHLAYTEFSESGSRVMIAAGDGSDPAPLDTLVPGRESERDPAFSPDGTLVAVTHSRPDGDGSTSTVRIVRVADGRTVGEVPMPRGLAGADLQPAFSPDGTRIALTRRSARDTGPVNVLPPVVDRSGWQGGSFTVDKTVHTPQVPAEPDILLLVDGTGSMSGVINQVKADLGTLVDRLRSREPTAQFAVAVYRDVCDGADRVFQVESQPIAVNTPEDFARLQDALGSIDAAGGCDTPEDWINALHEISTGAVDFRPDSSRVAVLVGDASSHDPSNGHHLSDVLNELKAEQVRVVAVPVGSADGLDAEGQATTVAAATNGVVMPYTPDPAKVADAIVAGIGSLSVTVTPVVTQCDPGLSVTFDPAGPSTVPGGQDAGFQETVHIGAQVPVGSVPHCTVEFRLNGENTVRPGYTESITVHVSDPRAPLVVVNPVTVVASSPLGAIVVYTVVAVDSSGKPLPAVCLRASGEVFAIGLTTVVCTATDSTGRTGSGSAPVVVLPPDGPDTEQVWVVGLDRVNPDSITFTDQLDLSARLAAPCAGGRDGAPDWAPAGGSVAFQHDDTICVSTPDGGGARQVITDTGQVYRDPAFSPDGAALAVTGYPPVPAAVGVPAGQPGVIYLVPLASGTPTALIKPAGGAAQPAFQRLPDLAVTASAAPSAVDFGGTSTLRFTVTNHGASAIPDARWDGTLPTGLRLGRIQPSQGACAGLTCSIGAIAPGKQAVVQLTVTGVEAGEQTARATVATGRPDPNEQDNQASVRVTVGAQPPPPVGTLSVTAAVNPAPAAYVGGDDLELVYTVRNDSAAATPAVGLAVTLPAGMPSAKSVSPGSCTVTGCSLGDLNPGQAVEVRLAFPAAAAMEGTTSATVTSAGFTTTATAPIVVRQPVLRLDPEAGEQGFVTRVLGEGLPPGATIRLTWSPGISQLPGDVVVKPDGTIDAQMLIFHHDQLGLRSLVGKWVAGPKFGDVTAGQQFLVLPRSVQPPQFVDRN